MPPTIEFDQYCDEVKDQIQLYYLDAVPSWPEELYIE